MNQHPLNQFFAEPIRSPEVPTRWAVATSVCCAAAPARPPSTRALRAVCTSPCARSRKTYEKRWKITIFNMFKEVNHGKSTIFMAIVCDIIRGYIISPWYPHDIPMGIGWTDRTFKAENLEATSQWNFEDVLKIFWCFTPRPATKKSTTPTAACRWPGLMSWYFSTIGLACGPLIWRNF